MTTLLLPCDGTPNALHSVRHAVDACRTDDSLTAHLLNVQPSFLERVGIPAGVGAGVALLWVGGS